MLVRVYTGRWLSMAGRQAHSDGQREAEKSLKGFILYSKIESICGGFWSRVLSFSRGENLFRQN